MYTILLCIIIICWFSQVVYQKKASLAKSTQANYSEVDLSSADSIYGKIAYH